VKPRLKWEDNIKIDLSETGWKGVNLIRPSAQTYLDLLISL